jgi:hypothetical protein
MFQVHNARARRIQRGRTALSDELAGTSANQAATSTALDVIATGVLALDALIVAFQNSPGTLSPGDQAALDGIFAASAALSTKASAISTAAPVPGA